MQDAELRYQVSHSLPLSSLCVQPQRLTIVQVRRLAPHPAVAVYDGCNECGGQGIYASFVMTTVAEEDPSRPPWPSSPSPGWVSGVDRLTSLPNGLPLTPTVAADAFLIPRAVRGSAPRASLGCADCELTRSAVKLASEANRLVRANGNAAACTFVANIDSCQTCFNMSAPQAASPADCCALCAAAGTASCYSASFYLGTCYFKPQGASPVVKPGVVSCWPTGHGPVPTPPPPQPAPPQTREVHGPYQHGDGDGFQAVNSGGAMSHVDVTLPPNLFPEYILGPEQYGTFTSEFGCVGMSSFESMAPTLPPDTFGLHGNAPSDQCPGGFFRSCTGSNVMSQRNYAIDSLVTPYFGSNVSRVNESGGEHAEGR